MQSKVEMIEEWYELYSGDIYKYICYSVKNDQDDILQEVFLKALKGSYKHDKIANPKAWLFTTARHVIVDFRRKKKEKVLQQVDEIREATAMEENQPLQQLLATESEKALYEQMKKLKQSYQEVLLLKGIHQLSTTETAQILQWNENKVRLTLHRALKSLKNIIEQEGGIMNE